MKFTNKLNLPGEIASAVMNKEYSAGAADISVTGLLQPPQVRRLTKLYGSLITQDVSDQIWSLFGTAVHKILEMSGSDKVLSEERFYLEMGDWIVSGQPDLYDPETGILSDYKVTSVWKILKNDFQDWEAQLNEYALLLRQKGYEVKGLEIVAILRDWSSKDARDPKKPDYPPSQVVKIPIPFWKPIDTVLFMAERIKLHQQTEEITDTILLSEQFPCSKKDRWQGEDSYVLYKAENNYTYKVFPIKPVDDKPETYERYKQIAFTEAQEAFGKMKTGGYEVVFREGEPLRCKYFCPVAEFCYQYTKTKPQAILEGADEIDYNNLTLQENNGTEQSTVEPSADSVQS